MKMSSLIFKNFILLIGFVICLNAEPEPDPANDGKYRPSKIKYNDGKYVPDNQAPIAIRSIDSNAYDKQGFFQRQYKQKGDNVGKYVHKVYPYVHVHDNRELGRYVHVHIPYDGGYGPYSGDIDKYRYMFDGKGVYESDNRGDYSLYTTTTTTTQRPRTRYDDEGKWRIIRQEEQKNQKRYDYLYLTENGIYAEEQAKLINQNMKADGTNAQGYYQYTGDDGKLYKVVYTVGEQGFVPMGEHIPTPPPVPIEIQRALEYVAAKKKAAAAAAAKSNVA